MIKVTMKDRKFTLTDQNGVEHNLTVAAIPDKRLELALSNGRGGPEFSATFTMQWIDVCALADFLNVLMDQKGGDTMDTFGIRAI